MPILTFRPGVPFWKTLPYLWLRGEKFFQNDASIKTKALIILTLENGCCLHDVDRRGEAKNRKLSIEMQFT